MQIPGVPIVLVYNGELYNYKQLRQELETLGDHFVTNGDTEVILRMIVRYGVSALPRFDGMFAIAAWDTRDQSLLLARDPIGEKPLFYANPAEGDLAFGSEIKAILCLPTVKPEMNVASVRQVLRFRAVYGTSSLYRGVESVRPGHFIKFSVTGAEHGCFFNLVEGIDALREQLRPLDEAELLARGRKLLEESVRERLMADVPLGLFLSGGLDSSLLSALVCREAGRQGALRTYSVGFKDDPHSELPFAREVATHLGTDHTEVVVGASDYMARLQELTWCRDGPVSEPADVAIACMSRVARRSVKVVLSGEGADEIFGGYPKYRFAGLSPAVVAAARALGPRVLGAMTSLAGLDPRRSAVAIRALCSRDEVERLSQWFSYVELDSLRQWLPALGWADSDWQKTMLAQTEVLAKVGHWSAFERMQAVDCLTWLPCNLLERGDRMTMAEGLESRPPFLDKELVQFGLALPRHMKFRGGRGKWIARQWAASLIPAAILNRKKWGFRVPLAQWFRGEMREFVRDHLLSRSGFHATYGNRAEIEKLLDAHLSGERDLNLTIWSLLTTELWGSSINK
jgi:asparagine synthase (glutamine-hydrolysing)